MLVEEITCLLYSSMDNFVNARLTSSLDKLIPEVNIMTIIKQSINNGAASRKVTFGNKKNTTNHSSDHDKNDQTAPLRPNKDEE